MGSSGKKQLCHFGDTFLSGEHFLCKTNTESGFSLLELVAVVTVLGILSSITIPRIGNIISSPESMKQGFSIQQLLIAYKKAD